MVFQARIAMNDFGIMATLRWQVPAELGGGPLSHEAEWVIVILKLGGSMWRRR